jgi:hypothetical protein
LFSIICRCYFKIVNALLNGDRLVINMSHLHRCFSKEKESYGCFRDIWLRALNWRCGHSARKRRPFHLVNKPRHISGCPLWTRQSLCS